MQAGLLRGTSRLDHLDQDSFDERNPEKVDEERINELALESEPGADHAPLVDQRRDDPTSNVRRDGEADTLGLLQNSGGDADDLSLPIQQRSPGIAGVN